MVPRGRPLLREHALNPGRNEDRSPTRRTDPTDAWSPGTGTHHPRTGCSSGKGDRCQVHRMLGENGHWRPRRVLSGPQGKYARPMGKDCEAKTLYHRLILASICAVILHSDSLPSPCVCAPFLFFWYCLPGLLSIARTIATTIPNRYITQLFIVIDIP